LGAVVIFCFNRIYLDMVYTSRATGFCCFFAICILISVSFGLAQKEDDKLLANYVTTTVLSDGEIEKRIRFGKILMRQTSVTETNPTGFT